MSRNGSQGPQRAFPGGAWGAGALSALLLVAAPRRAAIEAQPPDPLPLGNETVQVTEVELRLGFDESGGGIRAWARGEPAQGPRLLPEDLLVRVDGRPIRVLSIERPLEEVGEEESGRPPWQVVLWFEAGLSHRRALELAARSLADRADRLTALGSVRLVIADPDPRLVMPPTRSGRSLHDALSAIGRFDGAADALLELREDFLDTAESQDDIDAELVGLYAGAETRSVLRQQDVLLEYLLTLNEPASGRVLIYVGQGFDDRPMRFYSDASDLAPDPWELARQTREWAGTLAAHGWIALSLPAEPEQPLLVRGLRLGKWRFRGVHGGLLAFGRESERDADLADAELELAESHAAQAEWEAARSGYESALHHYYRDPRTSDRQGRAWIGLARALHELGLSGRARWALANARELDPALVTAEVAGLGMLLDGRSALELLADATGGRVIEEARELDRSLREIARRQRLLIALDAPTRGELLPIEVSRRDGRPVRHPRWLRSGIPLREAEARLRLFLDRAAEIEAGDLPAELVTGGAPGLQSLEIVLPEDRSDGPTRALVAISGDPTLPPRITALARTEGRRWRTDVGSSVDEPRAALWLEDVTLSRWEIADLRLRRR